MNVSESDVLVVGGGIVGASLAYGLARLGRSVRLLDEGDVAFRAARGNFGLVWVQGKGVGAPTYVRWTLRSAAAWPALASALLEETGVDVQLEQRGGLYMCLDEDELDGRRAMLAQLRDSIGADYPFEVLDHGATAKLCPEIGPDVVGATLGPLDGHTSPLRLLRALMQGLTQRGGQVASGQKVKGIAHRGGVFDVTTESGRFSAPRIVLTAGLGNRDLAPRVGLAAPVAAEPRRDPRLRARPAVPALPDAACAADRRGQPADRRLEGGRRIRRRHLAHRAGPHRAARGAHLPAARRRQRGARLGRTARDDRRRPADLRGARPNAPARSWSPATAASRSPPCTRTSCRAGSPAASGRRKPHRLLRPASMFKRLESIDASAARVDIVVDGEPVSARAGETVAAALLSAGRVTFRHTPVSGAPRAPLCLMGICFDCLVEIDGAANQQSCMVIVRPGMTIRLQHAARRVGAQA